MAQSGQEVDTNKDMVPGHKPDDFKAIDRKMIEEIAEGQHDINRTNESAANQPEHESPNRQDTDPIAPELPDSNKIVPIEEISRSARPSAS